MPKLSLKTWTAVILALLSLGLLAWSFQPLGRSQTALRLRNGLEGRRLRVDMPQALWAGQTGRAALALEAGAPLGDPIAAGNQVLEARLELAGIAVQPQDAISETMRAGQPLHFSWSLYPALPGSYAGTLWVYLNTVPKEGGDADHQALLALPVEIESRASVFGLPVGVTRWAGGLGLVAGLLLFLLARISRS